MNVTDSVTVFLHKHKSPVIYNDINLLRMSYDCFTVWRSSYMKTRLSLFKADLPTYQHLTKASNMLVMH